MASNSETPLPSQQRCSAGHLSGPFANYCSVCGERLAEGGDE